MVRSRLVKAWREARKTMAPVEAWASIVGNPQAANSYKEMRGRGGFVRANWDEVSEIIAAANVYTIKTFGPDRVVGFSPYLSLIGGTLLSFYDWYCDLPPSSPQTLGRADGPAEIGRLVQFGLHHQPARYPLYSDNERSCHAGTWRQEMSQVRSPPSY